MKVSAIVTYMNIHEPANQLKQLLCNDLLTIKIVNENFKDM